VNEWCWLAGWFERIGEIKALCSDDGWVVSLEMCPREKGEGGRLWWLADSQLHLMGE